MASSVSEEQLLCCICLNVFTDPVSTPCGHNFCKKCLDGYWDNSNFWKCPLCNKIFENRPELLVNTFISETVLQFRKSADTGKNRQHFCQKHEKPLERFCRDDQTCLCLLCCVTDHNTHNTVPIEEASSEFKLQENPNNKKGISWIQKLLLISILPLILLMSTKMWIRFYSVDVTLDPDTAQPELILSDDGKQVTDGDIRQNLPDNPERFDPVAAVLGKQGFSSGRFYYEVQVSGKTDWDVGVARESINRKGHLSNYPKYGLWTLVLRNGNDYYTAADKWFSLPTREKPQKVGVFVDYDEGLVSFYNAETRSHISSFTDQDFNEKLYPYFNPWPNDGGRNSAPLIISGGYKGLNILSKIFHNLACFFRQISLVFDS